MKTISHLFPLLACMWMYGISSAQLALPNTGPTQGGIVIDVTMGSFGPEGPDCAVYVDTFGPATILNWDPFTISFTLPAGAGFGLPVNIILDNGDTVVCSNTFSYLTPSVQQPLFPDHGPTSGGTNVIFTGSNLGLASVPATVLVDAVPSTFVSHTHTNGTFVTPPGTGPMKSVTYTVGGQTSNTVFFSYDSPVLYSLNPSSGPTSGGTLVTVTGNNFGPAGTPALVTVGSTPATNVVVIDHDSLQFLSPAGAGANKAVTVTVASQFNTSGPSWSYSLPSIVNITPTSGAAAGGDTVLMTGLNFGPPGTPATVSVGGVNAPYAIVLGHTSLKFVTPPGVGTGKMVSVSIADQSGTPQPLWSYLAPLVNMITPGSGPTVGGTAVTIQGTNFGPPGTPAQVLIDENLAGSIFVVSDSIITCQTPPGAGANQSVTVAVAGQQSNAAPVWSYTAPMINTITPSSGSMSGGTFVTVTGTNFGPPGTPVSAKIGNTPATSVNLISHSTMTFLSPPGVGLDQNVMVTVDGQNSDSLPVWDYLLPVLDTIIPASGPTLGGTLVTATGMHFGPAGSSVMVTIGELLSPMVTVISDSVLTFTTPPGAGTDKNVTIIIQGQGSIQGPTFDYHAPVIFGASPNNGPTQGLNQVVITGQNFGPPGTQISVTIDSMVSPQVVMSGQTSITFVAPPGSGANKPIQVFIAGQPSNTFPYSYTPPSVTNLSPASGPEEGGTLVTVTGNNFGPPGTPITIAIDTTPVQNLMHISHTMITFTTPPGTGANRPVYIHIDGQLVTPLPAFSYMASHGVGIGTTDPHHSAALDIVSTTSGLLVPRMTTAQRTALSSPANGLLVYDTSLDAFFVYAGTIWKKLAFAD